MRLKPLQLAQMRSDPTWHARDLPKQMVRGQSSLPHHKTCHPAFIPVVTSSVDCCSHISIAWVSCAEAQT